MRHDLVGLAGKGVVMWLGAALRWTLAANQEQDEARRRHAEERAARREKAAQQLWRRAQRERQRAELLWKQTMRERRRAEAVWRRVLTGVDPPGPEVRISEDERDRLIKILGMLGSDQPGEVASAARHAEAIRNRLGV